MNEDDISVDRSAYTIVVRTRHLHPRREQTYALGPYRSYGAAEIEVRRRIERAAWSSTFQIHQGPPERMGKAVGPSFQGERET